MSEATVVPVKRGPGRPRKSEALRPNPEPVYEAVSEPEPADDAQRTTRLHHVSFRGVLSDGTTDKLDHASHQVWLGSFHGWPGVWIDHKDGPSVFVPRENVGEIMPDAPPR